MKWTINKGTPYPLGVRKTPTGLSFAVEVPKGKNFELVLYKKHSAGKQVLPVDDACRYGNVLAFEIESKVQTKQGGQNTTDAALTSTEEFLYENYEYTYLIDGQVQLDTYAKALTGRRKFGCWKEEQMHCGFVQEGYDWQGDCLPQIPLSEVILYNLHVRGFTKHSSSAVTARGTFQGIMEKIPYMKELGVNQVELMPIYEFAEVIVEEDIQQSRYREDIDKVWKNFWGYSKYNYYFAVKQTFAQEADASLEFKELVRQLHANGMEVVLEFYFPKGTVTGLVQEVLRYWALEYHVDGFHVSGRGICVKELLEDPVLADRKLYSADLFGIGSGEAYQEKSWFRRAAVSNIDYMVNIRSFLKGDFGKRMDVAYYLRRSHKNYGFINYLTSHDGFTMYDLVSYEHRHNEANGEGNQDGWEYNISWNCGTEGKTRKLKVLELRMRQMKNAWIMLLLSQGVPAILAGDELCNSQNGNNNAYCQDNETGWVNWNCPKYFDKMRTFVQKLIQIRREHPVFHMEEVKLLDEKGIGYPDMSYHSDKAWSADLRLPSPFIGILLCGDYAVRADGATDDSFYLACNLYWNRQIFALPDAPKGREWKRLLTTSADNTEEGTTVKTRTLEVLPRTIEVLIATRVQEKKHGKRKKSKKA